MDRHCARKHAASGAPEIATKLLLLKKRLSTRSCDLEKLRMPKKMADINSIEVR
jgi:hypothetical protein